MEGDARDKPAPVDFPQGWSFKPDMIVEMPQDVSLPAQRRAVALELSFFKAA